jgi:hypothetical protein
MSVTRLMIRRHRCRALLPATCIVDLLQSGVRRSCERSGGDRPHRLHQKHVARGTYISSAAWSLRRPALGRNACFNGEERHESWVH